jgi:hypothetical protein
VEVPDYIPLLVRAKAQDTTLNFRDLRLAYTGTAGYSPYGTRDSDLHKSIYAAADSNAFSLALALADSLIAVNFNRRVRGRE